MELGSDGFPIVISRPIQCDLPIEARWSGVESSEPLPLVVYFSLSAEKSLTLAPYNQFVAAMVGAPLRVLSITLPEHGDELSDEGGMGRWARAWAADPQLFTRFFYNCRQLIDLWIGEGKVRRDRIALAGLSRGAWVATQLASLEPGVTAVVGLAPLLELMRVREFAAQGPHRAELEDEVALKITHSLLQASALYTIGNADRRTHTELTMAWVDRLARAHQEAGRRSPPVDLIVYPSVGRDGHGTPPKLFRQAASWTLEKLGIQPGSAAWIS